MPGQLPARQCIRTKQDSITAARRTRQRIEEGGQHRHKRLALARPHLSNLEGQARKQSRLNGICHGSEHNRVHVRVGAS